MKLVYFHAKIQFSERNCNRIPFFPTYELNNSRAEQNVRHYAMRRNGRQKQQEHIRPQGQLIRAKTNKCVPWQCIKTILARKYLGI